MIFGVVDIGSHTLRLAIYERKNGADSLLTKTKFALGLAGYLKDGVMAKEGVLALLAFLKEFRKFLDAFEIKKIYAFATAALRMAKNQKEILELIQKETGFRVKVLTGSEEAMLAFTGATKDSPVKSGLLLDIGGGSTEIVSFDGDKILEEYSLPIGAVSLSKKYNGEYFPKNAVREKISIAAKEAAIEAGINLKAKTALALGGAAKGAKLILNRDVNDSVSKVEIDELLERFKSLTDNDKSLLLRLAADRAPILITGFLMLSSLMEVFGCEKFYYRSGGVREGYIDRFVK